MADVTVDGAISSATSRAMRSMVFSSATAGYAFYIDGDGTFGYSKTTDGGATWGAQVEIAAATTHLAFDVWFDQWTPGDSGTLIYTWYFDTTNDTVFWRSLDTSSDTLGTQRAVLVGVSAVAARGAFCSGTKTRSGYLYVAFDMDAGVEKGLHRSTDSGTTWSANLDTGFVEASGDECALFPATGTGDNNDCWAIYHDQNVSELTMKMWDSSGAAQVESASFQACVDCLTDIFCQRNFSGSVRPSNGNIFVASYSEVDTASTDFQTWDVSAVNAGSLTGITAKTNIITNQDNVFYVSVYVDPSDRIYVAYVGKRDGSEPSGSVKAYYTKSTDTGSTWSAGDTTYMQGTAGDVRQIWTPLNGLLFYADWRLATTTLIGNAVNSVAYVAPTNTGAFFPFFQA